MMPWNKQKYMPKTNNACIGIVSVACHLAMLEEISQNPLPFMVWVDQKRNSHEFFERQ